MSRKSKQLSWRKKSLRAAFGRKLHIEPLEQRQLLDAAPLPLPTPNIPAMPKLQPTVITAGGQRLLLNYFNNASNAAHNPAAEVQVTFDSSTDTLVCNKPGWYVENFPLTQINGLQGDSADTVANLVFGAQHATDVQNWYIMTPVDATHPAPAEPPAPNGPAPITPTNLTATVNGSHYHILVVDNGVGANTLSTNDPYVGQEVASAQSAGAVVDQYVYTTITAAVNALTSSAYYSSTSQSVTQPTIILITPGTTSYEESPNLSTLNGTSTSPLILEGVPDASGNLPVWGDFTQITGWQQVTGTSGVYKSALSVNPSLYLENVVEHTNSIVNGDLTPGSGNQQTLIERSLPSDLQEGEMTYQFSSDEFENNLHGMSSQSTYAQVPATGLPSNATWTTVNTTSVAGDPGYLDFGSTGAGAAANSVYWASTWVWVPPDSSGWNWQEPETVNSAMGNFTYGPFRISRNASEPTSDQYNKDRIWVNGQMIPADIFSTATDNESLDPHSYPWAGDNVWGSLTAADGIQELNLLQGWNHLVFQFDTSDTASANNKFQSAELAFKFGLNSQFFPNSSGLISQATAPANLSQAPTTGTPEPYISQYSVLSTSPTSIVTPFINETLDFAMYVRLRNGENPNTASVGMSYTAPVCPAAFTEVRGLDVFASGVVANRQGDVVEGCIAQVMFAESSDEPSYAVGPNLASGHGIIGYGSDADALDFSSMGWTNNIVFEPDCQIANGTPVSFISNSPLPPSVSANEFQDAGGYHSQVYYLGLTGTPGVYDVYSDSACTQKVAISTNWTSQYNSVSIQIGLGNTAMTPVTYLNNWIINAPDTESETSGLPPNLVDATNENGVTYGRMKFIVENNMFKNEDTGGAPLAYEDGDTKSFWTDGDVFCYNVYDGGSDEALWFDTENWDDRIEGNIFENFSGSMVNFEASPGPNLIANNIMSGILGMDTPNGFAPIWNNSSNQTWAVNNTIDSQSQIDSQNQGVSLPGVQLGYSTSVRLTRWEWPSGWDNGAYDMYGGYNNDPTDAYVNNVVLGCQTAVDADLPYYHTGYAFLPDTMAGNYTDNPDDLYLTDEHGAQTQYHDGLQLLSQNDMGFVNQASGDYQLTADSPLNNAGVTSAAYSNGSTITNYNVMSLVTQDAYGLLRDIPGDPQSAGAARPGINFSSTNIEWENAAGAQARITDYFPSGPSSPPVVTISGPVNNVFTLTRDGSTTNGLPVNYTLGGTATYGSSGQIYDYTLSSGQTSVTIPAGYATTTITVVPQNDGVATGATTAVITLSSSPGNYMLAGQMAGTATLAAHDPATVSISGSGTITEGGSPGTFTVSRTGSTARALVVYYNTINGTATNGVDYQTLSGQVTIPASQTTAAITLTPTEDMVVDATETATLTIVTDPNNIYTFTGNNQSTISIADTTAEDGLVANWKLDETSGTTVSDSSANGLNGTLQNSPASWSSGLLNGALTLNSANNQYVSVPSNSDFNFGAGAFTLSAWVKSDINGTIFQNPASYGTGTTPQAVAVGDFNGDGKPDLAVVNNGANSVSILLGNGNGTFPSTPSYTYSVGSSPSAIAVGDFNGDGKLDLAIVDTNSNRVSILLGNGDGTFLSKPDLVTGTAPFSIAVGNFNPGTDSYTDLAVTSYVNGKVSIFLGNNDGTFQGKTDYTTGSNPRSIVAGDFNNDGKLDLATANNGGSVSILLNSGNGTFPNATTSSVGTNPRSIIAGDFNGDGKLDLATANTGANSVSILLNNGNGTFPSTPSYTYTVGSSPTSIIAGDFNGDGTLDLATANNGYNSVSLLLGTGNGTFLNAVPYAAGTGPYGLAIGDFNGDARPDLAVTNSGVNNVSIILSIGGVQIGAQSTILARGQSTANYFEFGMSYGANNGIYLTVGSGGTPMTLEPAINESLPLGNDTWHLVTVTRNGTSGLGTMYIDGQSVGTLAGMNAINVSPADSRNLGIGACLDQGSNYKYFNGELDDVRVYNTCLSSTEVGIMAGIQNGVSIVANDPLAGVNDRTPDNAVCYPSGGPWTLLDGFNARDTVGQGQFTLTRTGNVSQQLTVYYNVTNAGYTSGAYELIDAQGNVYTGATGQATFLSGQITTTITVQPLATTANASDETVTLTLIPDSQYELAAQSAADTAAVNIMGKRLQADFTLNGNANDSSGNDLNGILNPLAGATNMFAFNGAHGANPQGNLIQVGSTLYGMASYGGADGYGDIFSIGTNGNNFYDLYDFTGGADGANPIGSLILSGTTLYGMTQYGGGTDGNDGNGVIFSIDLNGTNFHTLVSFTGLYGPDPGMYPVGNLTLSGSTLYGMTQFGGAPNAGNIFSVNTNGNNFYDLYEFSGGADGAYPFGNLTLSGSTLYGMTFCGGINYAGNIFSISTNGNNFYDLYDFTGGSDGAYPFGSLTMSGSTLYGMTSGGGDGGDGVIFSFNPNGSNYQTLVSFSGTSGPAPGANPQGDLTLVGSTLYGMTNAGGADNDGVIFSVNPNGSDFQTLVSFSGASGPDPGANPYGDLTLSQDGSTLYGMSYGGGSSGDGFVFSLAAGTTWATGSGLTLNGTNQYVSLPGNSALNFGAGTFTLSAWIKLPTNLPLGSTSDFYPIISNNTTFQMNAPEYQLAVAGGYNNGLYFGIGNAGTSNFVADCSYWDIRSLLTNGQWHLITAVLDDTGTPRIYCDGVSVGWVVPADFQNLPATNATYDGLAIGFGGSSNYFEGAIADVQVYSRALEPGEIENLAVLGAPTGLTATVVSTSQINLTWTAPATEVDGYNVYRSTTPGGENYGAPINGATLVTGATYNDTTVASGTTYYYTVEAVNGAGGSIASNEAIALTVPAAPTGLGATPISATQINLSWTAPSGTVTGYYVYRGTAGDGESATALNTTAITTTSYSDATATAGTTYYYKVEAANGTGNGANSNEASALTVPAAPTGLGATPISATQINLAWTSPGGTVTGYYVYRGTAGDGESATALNTTAITTTSYSDATAVAGTTYYYKVEAANGTGNGANSNEASALTVPAAPTGLGATPISATQINLSWTAPSGTVTGYYVYRGTSTGGESGTALNTTALTTTSYSDTTAVAGTTYYYKVEAANGTGNGANSNEASALTVPAAPTGLGATPISATQINLTWTAPSGTVTGYYVYRGTSTGGESATALNTTAITTTSYSDATAVAGTTYYYKVEAANGTGNGANSNEASALTVPAAPTGLGATPISATQINLTWTAPSGTVTGYYVYRGTAGDGESATALNTTAITTTSYSDATATAGTTYYYKVEAANGTGNGANSNEASALTVPAAPTGLGATPISATQINLTWTAPSGTVTGYYVYRGTAGDGESATALNTTALTTTSYSDATAVAGTTYYYKVEATNGTGNGANSNEASALTVPAAPTGLGATPISATQINLTWTAPSGTVTGYYVYRGTSTGGESVTALNTTALTTTSYSDATAVAGTTYYYKVEAANATGNGANSNEASAVTAPTGLTATASASSSEINLSWTAAGGPVTSYNVYRGATQIYSGTATAFSDTGRPASTPYSYTVTVTNGSLTSAASAPASATTTAALSLPTNLVAYWRLDEKTGTTAYDTATGGSTADNGTLTGSPTWATGKIGNALTFASASSQYVNVPYSTDLNITSNTITIACWAKAASTTWNSANPTFVSRRNDYMFGPYGSYGVQVQLYIGSSFYQAYYNPGSAPSGGLNSWHDYAAVYNGGLGSGNIQLYVDGSAVTTTNTNKTGNLVGSTSYALSLGRDYASTLHYLNGSLDEVRLYNSALASTAISALYSQAALSVTANSHGTVKPFALTDGSSGVHQYSDQSYYLNSSTTMNQFTGSTFIQTADADRLSTGSQLLSFTTNTPCVMYVLYDTGLAGSHKAAWLSAADFTDTGTTVTNNHSRTFEVYKKVISSGTMWLGGNTGDGSDGGVGADMYTVIFQPMCWNGTTIV